ncbi:uncharacterized protein LOC125668188 isoform X2 [Ostrea edulis]|nr:uncharacterized protein LOC125668188 isoform X2 [Ostrea edulis]XP_056020099.1 uncharacterized protein LOC125668188 isoform X2 [Ostrea edulis]XP_056020100.1 uncharacterized protein LOC125668188 isoform X2 [Ostrea edulis]XP_056020101.1 uncharacterized protein LOC125668188 isoform X2 [Ostrea edulis]
MDDDKPPSPVYVTKNRVEAKEYFFRRPESSFGSCLIINIPETRKKITGGTFIRKFRTGYEAEVKELEFRFGYDSYYTEIQNGENVIGEVDKYIERKVKDDEEGNFKSNDIFVCVVLAFGGPGFFYDPNGNKIPLSRVVQKFQSCAGLLLKPKIFIVQTCSIDLRPIGKHLFDEGMDKDMKRGLWPREADVLIYESNISGEYDWHPGLIKHDPKKFKGVPGLKSCTFIKMFCATLKEKEKIMRKIEKEKREKEEMKEKEEMRKEDIMKEMRDEEKRKKEEMRIEFKEVILGTNLKLQKFINNKMSWDLQEGTWSSSPRLPIVTDQLTKSLYVPRY